VITFLHGEIAEKQPTHVVIDVGGVGYGVSIPLSSYDGLPAKGQPCRILTYEYVREDIHELFGFMTEAERRMFTLLIGTNGVGPKLALSALSGMSVRDITVSVAEGDVKRLSSISGVGKKMAERIVVELRHKIGAGETLEAISGEEAPSELDTKTRDAVLALVALGYKQEAARKMVSGAVGKDGVADLALEDIIRKALGG